jgi:hypothetical protein
MSARLRHIRKNAKFTKSPKVEAVEGLREDIVTTMAADPVGTSAGSVILNSRLAGISVSNVTVFTMKRSSECDRTKAILHLQEYYFRLKAYPEAVIQRGIKAAPDLGEVGRPRLIG